MNSQIIGHWNQLWNTRIRFDKFTNKIFTISVLINPLQQTTVSAKKALKNNIRQFSFIMFSRIMKFTCKIWAFAIPRWIFITNCETTKNVSFSVAPSISRQKLKFLTVSATTYHHKIIQGNWPLTPTILLFTSS